MKKSHALDKTLLKLRYLEKERDSCKEICESARLEIDKALKKMHHDFNVHDSQLDSGYDKKKIQSETTNDPDINFAKPKPISTPSWAKKLFRKIAVMTHPDKVPERLDENLKSKLLRIYQESKESIDSGDHVKLAMLATELDVGLSDISLGDMSDFKFKESQFASEIKGLKSSIYWSWAHSTDEQKEKILREFVKLHGWDSREKQRTRSRKGPGNHPGKSISQMRNKSLYEKK